MVDRGEWMASLTLNCWLDDDLLKRTRNRRVHEELCSHVSVMDFTSIRMEELLLNSMSSV